MAEIYRYKISWTVTETNYYYGYVEMTEQQYDDATGDELIQACIDNCSEYCVDSESGPFEFTDGECLDVVGDDGMDEEEEDLSEEFP